MFGLSLARSPKANMYKTEQVICRICLKHKMPQQGFVAVNELCEEMLNILLINLYFKVSGTLYICNDCIFFAKRIIFFKLMCINNEKSVLCSTMTDIEFPLKDVNGTIIERCERINQQCRICSKKYPVKRKFFSMDYLIDGPMSDILSAYMPEVDFNSVEDAVICVDCKSHIHGYYHFLLTYMETERKIYRYIHFQETQGRTIAEQISLIDVYKHSLRPIKRPVQAYRAIRPSPVGPSAARGFLETTSRKVIAKVVVKD